MGYRVQNRLHLVFEGEYEGAEAWCKLNCDFGDLLKFSKLGEMVQAGETDQIEDLMRDFAENALLEWNFEDAEGLPLPANYAGLQEVPFPLRMALLNTWAERIADIPDPLGSKSKDGSASREQELALAASSQSLPH